MKAFYRSQNVFKLFIFKSSFVNEKAFLMPLPLLDARGARANIDTKHHILHFSRLNT